MERGITQPFRIEVLSPVHVNSGKGDLLFNVDFLRRDGIYVIDTERVLEDLPPQSSTGSIRLDRLSKLIRPDQYEEYKRYKLPNPGVGEAPTRILACVKDAFDRPYIPGSSVKGAIRTALAWAILLGENIEIDKHSLGYNPRYAANRIMGKLLGPDPNHDVLRALHVSDTRPVAAEDALQLSQVALYSLRSAGGKSRLEPKGAGFRFTLEALRSDHLGNSDPGQAGRSVFVGSLRLDDYLLKDCGKQLGFEKISHYLIRFCRHCNAFVREIIRREIRFFGSQGMASIRKFYEDLSAISNQLNEDSECLLQLAWGTGWQSKTLGMALDSEILKTARYQFRMGRQGEAVFPKSRKLVVSGDLPLAPLGWIKLSLSEM